jgi:zinc and cadmium transporter
MGAFLWILGGGILMSAIALSGSITLLLRPETLSEIILPLVAFAAGSLLGGAFFHMLPAAHERIADDVTVYGWLLAGFVVFLGLEQLLHWHHCQRAAADCRRPMTYLILIGDGLHNFLGGMAIAGTFLADIRLGVAAWLGAAAHEVPQELGDFGVLVHGGWTKSQALLFNLLSGLAFLVGGLVAWAMSRSIDVTFLIPFAAGNFLYIGASDLVPEVNKHEKLGKNGLFLLSFCAGVLLLWGVRYVFQG